MAQATGWSAEMDRRLEEITRDPAAYIETVRMHPDRLTFKVRFAEDRYAEELTYEVGSGLTSEKKRRPKHHR
jgi:hypothetical protein